MGTEVDGSGDVGGFDYWNCDRQGYNNPSRLLYCVDVLVVHGIGSIVDVYGIAVNRKVRGG